MRKQIELNLDKGKLGGRRKGAGRKRTIARGVDHKKREIITSSQPVHINIKMNIPVKSETGLLALEKSIANSRRYFHILHYSLQWNHIHLIIEAADNKALFSGMRSFTNTFVKVMGKGSIQKERYHLHPLKSMKETKNAFRYVIFNEVHHSKKTSMRADLFSSLHQLNIREMSRQFRVEIKACKPEKIIQLDQPASWLAKQGLKPT